MRTIPGSIFTILLLVSMVACGPAPTPTLSVEDVAGTAMADAWLAITQTQAAMPTNTATLVPPTPTVLPTFTPFPTLPPAPPTAAATSAEENPCNLPPPIETQGTKVKIKFVNKSGGSAALAFGMQAENSNGECGTYSFSFGDGQTSVVEVLAGCYWAYAWISGKEPSTAQNIENLCFTDPAQTRGLTIGAEVIGFD